MYIFGEIEHALIHVVGVKFMAVSSEETKTKEFILKQQRWPQS